MSEAEYRELKPGEIIQAGDFIFYSGPTGSGWTPAYHGVNVGMAVGDQRVIRKCSEEPSVSPEDILVSVLRLTIQAYPREALLLVFESIANLYTWCAKHGVGVYFSEEKGIYILISPKYHHIPLSDGV